LSNPASWGNTVQTTYFASYLLGERPGATLPSVGDAVETIAHWIFNNPYRQLSRPQGWPDEISEPINFPNGERVQLLRLENGGRLQTAAVRFEHPDQQSRRWRTDCIVTTMTEPEPAVRFAVTVAAGSSGDGLYPASPPRTRPRIVRSILEKFGGRERYPLKPKFVEIKAGESKSFSEFLLDLERTVPVVFVSRRNRDGELLCDPSDLADKLVGIAYVCVADGVQLSRNLADHIDNRLNSYDGTVRVHWSRMTPDDPPYRHRWWTQQRLLALEASGRSLADELLRMIADASVTRLIPGLVRWEDVEREITKQMVQQLESAGSISPQPTEDWLRQYELDLAALGVARRELSDNANRLREKEDEVRQWKQMYLQLLRGSAASSDKKTDVEAVIEDPESAIKTAAKDFKGRITFLDGRIEKDANLFEEPELLYGALKWLATIYRDAKAGIEPCSDLDKSCRETCQFRYNGHQSEITMGMFASDYEVTYRGAKVRLREHIGYGTSTEPRHTIRIAFFFDEMKHKVVIGYIGQHQATRHSN
jgi:hypothetical protein